MSFANLLSKMKNAVQSKEEQEIFKKRKQEFDSSSSNNDSKRAIITTAVSSNIDSSSSSNSNNSKERNNNHKTVIFHANEGFHGNVTHYYHFLFGAFLPLLEYHFKNRQIAYIIGSDIG
jgi:VIT1/CCC1 family predicted Fe2+/Mn2+ transporter